MSQKDRPRTLNRRSVVVFALCLIGTLLLAPSLLAYVAPASQMIRNPAFETGPGHFSPWNRAGDSRLIIGDESCCGQHETFFWPDGAAHGWQPRMGIPPT